MAGALSAGGCVRPVRLRPSMFRADPTTGELVPVSDELPQAPDGVVYKPCGDRRASVCPACAERYRQDTWQLIAAGLRAGKGVPAEVAGHPAVFLTLTAPSFGPVHTGRTASTGRVLPCRPRRKPALCPHGLDLRCARHHDQDESVLGLPLCLDCHDGLDPADPERIVPPVRVELVDLIDAIQHKAALTDVVTELQADLGRSWRIGWGEQLECGRCDSAATVT